MVKTRVNVDFNGAANVYFFSIDRDTFISRFNSATSAVGYYSGHDENGDYVVINPAHCGTVEITEINA